MHNNEAFFSKYKQHQHFQFHRPHIPLSIKQFLSSEKGCQQYYKVLMSSKAMDLPCNGEWEGLLGNRSDELWRKTFSICFRSETIRSSGSNMEFCLASYQLDISWKKLNYLMMILVCFVMITQKLFYIYSVTAQKLCLYGKT